MRRLDTLYHEATKGLDYHVYPNGWTSDKNLQDEIFSGISNAIKDDIKNHIERK